MQFSTREAWLEEAVELLLPRFSDTTADFPLSPRVSVGFGGTKAQSLIGWCWHAAAAEDGRRQIFISPTLVAPLQVLETLLHEMCHAGLPDKAGHGPKFKRLAAEVGLQEPWTATSAGPECQERLNSIATALGPYPHAKLTFIKGKKQSTRMHKVECGECGYVARVAGSWLEAKGPPICPCNSEQMEQAT